jgi:probable rRNA maturation factor
MSLSKRERATVIDTRDRMAVDSKRDHAVVDNRQRAVRLARRPLETFLRRVRDELGLGDAGVTICLVSDAEIARMNETFRKKQGPTDVLSFPAVARRKPRRPASPTGSGQAPGGPNKKMRAGEYLGDIAISPATARRYAREHGRKLSSELRVLILHGLLHLLGYDHETDRGEMARIERKLRKRFGLTG